MKDCAKRKINNVNENDKPLKWPPTVAELETPEVFNQLLLKFVSTLQNPGRSTPYPGPNLKAIVSALTSLITKKRTTTMI